MFHNVGLHFSEPPRLGRVALHLVIRRLRIECSKEAEANSLPLNCMSLQLHVMVWPRRDKTRKDRVVHLVWGPGWLSSPLDSAALVGVFQQIAEFQRQCCRA